MSTYVLVHGASHGAWCWDKVVPLLSKAGHKAIAVDLPGHGADRTPVAGLTMTHYAQRVCEVLDELPDPAILVGHSMGGAVISQVAECRPAKVKKLVYLTAGLLPNGRSLLQHGFPPDSESLLSTSIQVDQVRGIVTFQDEKLKELLYGDCSEEDVARAKSLLCPESLAAGLSPLQITEYNFGRVPRVYIQCLQDRINTPTFQRQMYTAMPCEDVLSLDTSHSPFFSAPEQLVAHLTSL